MTYPEDPQSGHQAAVTSLCHMQVASSETELFLMLLSEPGTDYQWNLNIYVPDQLFKLKLKTFIFTAELQN